LFLLQATDQDICPPIYWIGVPTCAHFRINLMPTESS